MRSPRRRRRSFVAAVTAALVTLLIVPAPAVAEEFVYEERLVLDPLALTVEYGEQWNVNGLIASGNFSSGSLVVLAPDFPEGYFNDTGRHLESGQNTRLYFYPNPQVAPLAPGDYTMDFTLRSDMWMSTWVAMTQAPAELTVVPAALTVKLAMTTDVSAPQNAILSATLTGRYAEQASPASMGPMAALLPAGTWRIWVTGPDGETVYEETADQAGGGPIAISRYWTGVPLGTAFEGHASFTPSTDVAPNFVSTEAGPLPYQSVASARPTPTSTPTGAPAAAAVSSGIPVPLIVLILLGLLIVAAVVAAVIVIVRSRRPKAAPGAVGRTSTTAPIGELS